MSGIKAKKFSYSKLNTYESCGWKYKLTYNDGHYLYSPSLAADFGTLVHYIEEHIAIELKNHNSIDYQYFKDQFQNLNIPKKSPFDTEGGVFGINILKDKYSEEYYAVDPNTGSSYFSRALDYLNDGIYRLENYLVENPNLEIYDMEKFFSVEFESHILSGYIDRIFYDKSTQTYIIEDIKTRHKLFKHDELTTPLQFVVYVYALSKALDLDFDRFTCVYDLPLMGVKQEAGTNGFMARGIRQLHKIFEGINSDEYIPNPTPLCHWCQFCPTNPDQPAEGKNLCPYYALWTRENKTREVSHRWEGLDRHAAIMQDEIARNNQDTESHWDQEIADFDFDF